MAGRTVIVTGGSRGLGAGIVQSFLDSGDSVATCSRNPSDEIDRWSNDPTTEPRFLFCPADVSQPEDCERLVNEAMRRFGSIDVLVNNAGVASEAVIALLQKPEVDQVVDLNLKGTIEMTRLVTRRMLARRQGGRVINITSIVGQSGYRGLSVYSATKAGLDGLTRSLARELGSRGITVNSVAPGYLRTEMSGRIGEDQLEQIRRRTPLGRLAESEDVAAAVQFLSSEGAGFISGQVLVVDGGLTA